ncbi:IPTL-CTERM sorting domain-containing protein [Comamonas testosteroni]
MKKILTFLGLTLITAHASATYTILLNEVGNDVVAKGSGSIDISGASTEKFQVRSGEIKGLIAPLDGILMGTLGEMEDRTVTTIADIISNPQPFGPGTGITEATSSKGDLFLFSGIAIVLPRNYASRASIFSENVYEKSTFSSLGVTPGTYTYNLTTGDKIVLNIGVAELLFTPPTSIPSAKIGSAYSLQLAATGGSGEISYEIENGTLPAGLTLNASTGLISGTPTTAGSSTITVLAKDGSSQQKSVTLAIVVDTQTLAPTPVPTLGILGIISLTSLLAMFGFARGRRRQE